MLQKVLIFGAKGWLAQKLNRSLEWSVLSATDILDISKVRETLDSVKPDVVINAAGKTGRPNIDWCEDHREETRRSNVFGPMVLAMTCAERGIYLVHLSSGCIFNGESFDPNGWSEEDCPEPVSYYGQTKVEAEYHLMDLDSQILILRLRMPVDSRPDSRNLITKLSRYSKVIDVINSVTVVDDFLEATAKLMDQRQTGIFNVTNPTPVSHREIMEWYRKLVDPDHRYELITADEMMKQGLAKTGRSNCILDTRKLSGAGIHMTDAPEAIKRCLQEYRTLLDLGH